MSKLDNFNYEERLLLIYLLGNAILAAYPEKFRLDNSDEQNRIILAPLISREIEQTSETQLREILATVKVNG